MTAGMRLQPRAAQAALGFAAQALARMTPAGPEADPPAFAFVRPPGDTSAMGPRQQIMIQHTVKMMMQAYLRSQPQGRPAPPPRPVPMNRLVEAILPRLVDGLSDRLLRHARRTNQLPPYRVPERAPDRVYEAKPPFPGLAFYQPERAPPLTFRRSGGSVAEIQHQVQRITRHVQSRVVHEISQATPWRSQLRDALRSPEVLRQLTDQLSRAIDRRSDIDRYRRGG